MSIDGPLQVRDVLLAPGQYVFRLTEPDSDLSIVSIFNARTNQLEGTIIGFPAYRLAADDKHVFTISQPQTNQPAKLQTWFYPGDNFGVEFPRAKMVMAVGKSNRQTPATAAPGDVTSTR